MNDIAHNGRIVTLSDLPALQAALADAIDWRSPNSPPDPEALIDLKGHGYLLDNWGRAGDTAVVAESEESAIGAAWYRYWTDDLHSYGYIDPATPELGLGVDASHRRRGVATSLLTALFALAREQGVRSLSLSVERDNPAVDLYQELGFERLCDVGDAWTMVKRIRATNIPGASA